MRSRVIAMVCLRSAWQFSLPCHHSFTNPDQYPDNQQGPRRLPIVRCSRGSPQTAPVPFLPSPGASASCLSRSGLQPKRRALVNSALQRIVSCHSSLPLQIQRRTNRNSVRAAGAGMPHAQNVYIGWIQVSADDGNPNPSLIYAL